jgi:O-antigen ligase
MSSGRWPAGDRPRTGSASDGTGGTFLLRPLTVAFFLVMLAGTFTFERLGSENPFLVPERLLGFTLLMFLVFVIGLANIRSAPPKRPTGLIIAVPLFYVLLTALWGAKVPEFWDTVVDLVCMLLAMAIISILLRWNTALVAETLLWCLLAAGIVYSVVGLASASAVTQIAAFGGGPNVFSRVTALGFVGLIGLVALRKLPIAALAAGPLMLVATVVSGSRGGMLAGLVSIGVLTPLARRLRPFHVVTGLGVLGACMIFVYNRYEDSLERVIGGRIVELTLQQGYTSGRGDLYRSAWDLFQTHPLIGGGLRSFAETYGQGYTYPHNLFLLTAAEGGLIGLLLMLAVLTMFAVQVIRDHRSTMTLLFTAAASVIFTSAMLSGGYYDSRFLWVFMLVALRTQDTS